MRQQVSSSVAEDLPGGLEVERLSKRYGDNTVLDDVSFTLQPGEFFTLLGPSGCGKTTLLRLIGGFETADGGAIRLDGKDLAALPAARRPINTVFQSYALFPHLSVADNVAFGLRMLGKPRREIAETVDRMLALVAVEALRDRKTGSLSGGQQQRVALARALAPQPRLLLLDEPLSALDLKLRQQMQLELKRLQVETGISFVFVTHDQDEALAMSDRIAVMDHGRIQQIGTPREIYHQPANRFVAGFVGRCNLIEGVISRIEDGMSYVTLAQGGVLGARPGRHDRVGDRVVLAMRPEHIRVGGAYGLQLRARVDAVQFNGNESLLSVKLDDGTILLVRNAEMPGEAPPLAGAEVDLCLPTGVAQVLDDRT